MRLWGQKPIDGIFGLTAKESQKLYISLFNGQVLINSIVLNLSLGFSYPGSDFKGDRIIGSFRFIDLQNKRRKERGQLLILTPDSPRLITRSSVELPMYGLISY